MNRRTNTTLKVAGIALALSGLGGALTGCGGSDSEDASTSSDGASPSAGASDNGTPEAESTEGFCEELAGLSAAAAQAKPDDTSAAVKALKEWVGQMEDYGTPSELSDEEREGFEVMISAFRDVDDDASMEELQQLGTDSSDADMEKVEAFSTWTTENCTPVVPSDAAS